MKARILSVLDRSRLKDFALKRIAILVDPTENDKYEEAMARAKSIILDGVKDYVVPHIKGHDKCDVGGPNNIVSAYFRAEEDAPRKSVVVIPDAEGRTYQNLPWLIEGDPRSADFHRGHTKSRVDGENNP